MQQKGQDYAYMEGLTVPKDSNLTYCGLLVDFVRGLLSVVNHHFL